MGYSYLDFTEDILRTAPRPLLPIEIWEIGQKSKFFNRLSINGKTPHASLAARLYVDVRDKPETTRFIKVTSDPARFFLKERENELNKEFDYTTDIVDDNSKKSYTKKLAKIKERELHPILSYFVYTSVNFNKGKNIYTKTVFHEKSKKQSLNQWVHPDIVGFSTPLEYWDREVINLNRITDNEIIKIYSFELKKDIDRNNYREYYFQAVSNSSWAHEGYIVAAKIDTEDTDLTEELERLTQAFGIGIIQLDIEDVDSSIVLYPAKIREKLDWKTINKLCRTNIDFREFIKDLKNDVNNEEIKKYNYDNIIEDIAEYIDTKIK
ncbi:HTH domain-containing protein [Marispirochaeta aestuarii]|uniref:HTH domain-containing protein n=1 Tax=Marispirochaeta aestuarii TaxID=1963862 RepID=UPI002ABD5A1D|nr:HTH domain-containing protein [Marispirochaeta aestuarii]